MVPVSIVTGFLGSGKTTLIKRILREPGFARTAVIVNEFGEIGLDHDLIRTGNETFVTLTTGCLCCAVRVDLIETLLELAHGAGSLFDRVLVETSGLADPAPILHALMTDRTIAATHVIDTIVTVVDPVHGETTLESFAEARRQIALADRLVFSKSDIAAPSEALSRTIRDLNGAAPLTAGSTVCPEALFAGADPMARAVRLAAIPDPASRSPFVQARHSSGIETVSFRRSRPVCALALTLWLQALSEHCGDRLLRTKGLVSIEEYPGGPVVVHGVQHVFAPPEFLDSWPSDDHDTRLVFIFRDMPRHFPARLLDAIEEEVRDELAAARGISQTG